MKKRTLMLSAIMFSIAPIVFGGGPEPELGITEHLKNTAPWHRECSLKSARNVPADVNGQVSTKDSAKPSAAL